MYEICHILKEVLAIFRLQLCLLFYWRCVDIFLGHSTLRSTQQTFIAVNMSVEYITWAYSLFSPKHQTLTIIIITSYKERHITWNN